MYPADSLHTYVTVVFLSGINIVLHIRYIALNPSFPWRPRLSMRCSVGREEGKSCAISLIAGERERERGEENLCRQALFFLPTYSASLCCNNNNTPGFGEKGIRSDRYGYRCSTYKINAK